MKHYAIISLAGAALVSLGVAIAMSLNAPTQVVPPSDLLGAKVLGTVKTERLERVRVTREDKKVELAKKEGKWVVADRGDYPLNDVKDVERLINSLSGLRVGQIVATDHKFADKVGLQTPDELEAGKQKKGEGEEDDPFNRPKANSYIELIDAEGEILHSIVVGESSGGTADQPLSAVYVRTSEPEKGIFLALGRVEKNSARASDWLKMKFLGLGSIKSIELKDKDPEYQWKVTKKTDTDSYVLEGLKEDEETDSSGVSAFNWSFGEPRFEDVLKKHDGKDDDAHFHHAVVTTFDGFVYDLKFYPIKKGKVDNTNVEDKPSTYALVVGLSAEDETAVNADPKLKKKFEEEKVFDGRVFQVSGANFNSAFKKRSDLFKEKSEEPENPATNPTPITPGENVPFRIPELQPGQTP